MAVDLKALMKTVEAAQKSANDANMKRYEELLASISQLTTDVVGAGGSYDQAAKLVENVGMAAREQIGEAAVKAGAMSEQDLTNRGLGNTTIRSAAQRGIAADKTKAELAQSESEAQQKSSLLLSRAGAQMGLGQMKAGAIEGRYDMGPDMGMFSSLIQAASAAPDEGKRTVKIGAGLPGPGFVTRKQAEAAAGTAAGAASGGSGGASSGGKTGGSGGGGPSPTGFRTIYGDQSTVAPSTGGGGGGERAPGGMRPAAQPASQPVAQPANSLAGTQGAGLAPGEGFIEWDDGILQGLSGATEGQQGAAITTTQGAQDAAKAGAASGASSVWGPNDYAEYKKASGKNAVSPWYFNEFFIGQPKGSK